MFQAEDIKGSFAKFSWKPQWGFVTPEVHLWMGSSQPLKTFLPILAQHAEFVTMSNSVCIRIVKNCLLGQAAADPI